MKVLLINPPFNRLKGLKKMFYPIGLGYIGAVLKDNGFEVKIYQVENNRGALAKVSLKNKYQQMFQKYHNYLQALKTDHHYVWNEIREIFRVEKPKVVGISCMTVHLKTGLKMADIIKEMDKECKVVFGGPHPTIIPDDIMQSENVDFAIRGEGEYTMLALCQAIADGAGDLKKIDGLSFKIKNRIIHNSPRKLIKDIDTLPFPLRTNLIFSHLFSPQDLGVMITSRGCPFGCTFCSSRSIWGKKVRYNAVKKIIDEIKLLVSECRTREFFFWDDSFSFNRERIIEICNTLIKEKIEISWGCTTRLDLLDDELLSWMRQAGCSQIDVGIESGSERILKKIRKGIILKQIKQGIKLITDHNIFVTTFFMIGFPDETEEDIRRTFDLIKNVNATVTISLFTPYPGTELFQNLLDIGMVSIKQDWSQISHQSPNNHFTKYIDRNTFRELVKEGMKIVDSHNKLFKFKFNYLRNNLSFYIRNPKYFFNKLKRSV